MHHGNVPGADTLRRTAVDYTTKEENRGLSDVASLLMAQRRPGIQSQTYSFQKED